MYPNESRLIAVSIEWELWNRSDAPWYRRGVGIWVYDSEACSRKVYDKLKELRHSLPLDGFEDNLDNHPWFPFVRQIPASVFEVKDNVVSVEECLYMANVNPKQLALNIWNNVFEPFATKKCSEIFSSAVN